MKKALLSLLRCPACGSRLSLVDAVEQQGEIERGRLACVGCSADYPIARYVPRFVPEHNYAGSFGFQWHRFRATQLDSHSGTTISRDRFLRQTGWSPVSLAGRRVLDVGCGAGRFAEIALSHAAEVFALDYSAAVDACWANLGPHPRLHVIQGDIYALPFQPRAFGDVYCFGVLQHTPNVRAAVLSLAAALRPGGRLALDVYRSGWHNVFRMKYWLRPFTRRLKPETLLRLTEALVVVLLPLSTFLGRLPRIGRMLRGILPVANYDGVYPLTPAQLTEWAILDTFDMLAPTYDSPQSMATIRDWLMEGGLTEIEVLDVGLVVGRGRLADA